MIALQMKQKLKQVYRLSAVLHSLPSRMNADAVRTILNDFSPDSATTCVGDNVVELKYDLQIIVPAYNAEKYISECLDSVLSQETEYSYLITIVNDGSIDHTLDIINSYYSRYPDRIEVINQENKGFSGARNAGLKVLKGKYITFLDSDDVLAPRGINSLLRNTIGEVDIVQGSWFTGEKLGGGHTLFVQHPSYQVIHGVKHFVQNCCLHSNFQKDTGLRIRRFPSFCMGNE